MGLLTQKPDYAIAGGDHEFIAQQILAPRPQYRCSFPML